MIGKLIRIMASHPGIVVAYGKQFNQLKSHVMKLKSFFAAAALFACGLPSSAQASPVWTVTIHGTIYEGTDTIGWFGRAGQDLRGLKYVQTITSDPNPSDFHYHYSDPDISIMDGRVPNLTDTVTVNGKTVFFDLVNLPYAGQFIRDAATRGGSDYLTFGVSGYDDTLTNWVQAGGYIYTDLARLAFMPNEDFTRSFVVSTMDGRYGNSTFYVETNGHTSGYFSSSMDTMTFYVNSPAGSSDVPEPGSVALFGLGVLGLSATRFRKTS